MRVVTLVKATTLLMLLTTRQAMLLALPTFLPCSKHPPHCLVCTTSPQLGLPRKNDPRA